MTTSRGGREQKGTIAEKHKKIMRYRSIARTFNPLTRARRVIIDHALSWDVFFFFLSFSSVQLFALTCDRVRHCAVMCVGFSDKKSILTADRTSLCENLRRPLILIYDKRDRAGYLVRGRSRGCYNWIVRRMRDRRYRRASRRRPRSPSFFLPGETGRKRSRERARGIAIT